MTYWLWAFFLFVGLEAMAQGETRLQANATLAPGSMLIGQQAQYNISVSYPYNGQHVTMPVFDADLADNIEIVHASSVDTTLLGPTEAPESVLLQQSLTITSWDSGHHPIPPLQFTLNGDTAETEVHLLSIRSVAVDTTKGVYDIKEVIDVPVDSPDILKEYWPWLVGIAGLAALSSILFWWLKRRKKRSKTPTTEEKPTLPPHELALKALEALKYKKLWQQGKIKAYHSEISEILRRYIEGRYHLQALEQTTDELVANLRFSGIPQQHQQQLIEVLMRADMVKFAKESPLDSENERSLSLAFQFIEATRITETSTP